MEGDVSHVFTKIVFVPSKLGVALDHIYQEITLRKLRNESDLQKLCLSHASVVAPVQSPQKNSFLSTLVDIWKNTKLSFVYLKTAISAVMFMEHLPPTEAESILLIHCKTSRKTC